MMEPNAVEDLLKKAFPDGEIELTDLTGTKDHYQAKIVSAAFEGKSPIQRHKLVYAALGDAMNGPIHALTLQLSTPAAS